ncbi:MAG: hypothetical protein HJJLKODD_00421 [Phycisphaerae bacterium]|nr:hypothetical protein [Phycisphaerae bacterium]
MDLAEGEGRVENFADQDKLLEIPHGKSMLEALGQQRSHGDIRSRGELLSRD